VEIFFTDSNLYTFLYSKTGLKRNKSTEKSIALYNRYTGVHKIGVSHIMRLIYTYKHINDTCTRRVHVQKGRQWSECVFVFYAFPRRIISSITSYIIYISIYSYTIYILVPIYFITRVCKHIFFSASTHIYIYTWHNVYNIIYLNNVK